MTMQNEEITQLIREILERMQFPAEAIAVESAAGRARFSVKVRDSHLLIGTRGAHLFALNHVVKKIVAKRGGEQQFLVDVNDYQGAAQEHLRVMAKMMGDRARSFKASVELEPMSSYERMMVHSFFEGEADLSTESVGVGERRRVVIKYTGE